jgi:hypothetical protein
VRRSLAAILAAACAALAAGCGAERAEPVAPGAVAEPAGERALEFRAAGMRLRAPANWRIERRQAPAVFTLRSGTALVSGFAYRREEPLPRSGAELDAAERRLVAQVRERDPAVRGLVAKAARVDGALAIELRAEQTISRRRLRTRSLHVFRGEAEYVVEALAAPDDFALVDERVLDPLLDSLELSGRVRAPRSRR